METICLSLSPTHRAKLLSAGYRTVDCFRNVAPANLARDIGVSQDEALDILKVAWRTKGIDGKLLKPSDLLAGAKTAWDLLCEEKTMKRIVTCCDDLDVILGGGISCREVTEVGGVPGIGKTQLGIQLAINVQIPAECGGVGGQAIYIDTEGSFMVERASQIAESCAVQLKNIGLSNMKGVQECERKLCVDDFLENIFYFRVCSYTEQIAAINYMDKFIEEHEKVVLMNQVTTKFSGGSFQLAPALGDSWSHACTNRVILYWNGSDRFAYIDKSPSLQSISAPFTITVEGIRNSTCNRSINLT